jgi:DNA repair protein RecN (Recombination protein N)
MLRQLSIRDIVLIQSLDLDFENGLTVLTGETGAGKSILLDALGLICGSRADSGLIRSGATHAVVSAQFELDLSHPACAVCEDLGLDHNDGQIVLRRTVEREGRSKAFINDFPVAVSSLRRIGATLIEVHGQHDDQSLLNPQTHRSLLDSFARIDTSKITDLWHGWKTAQSDLSAYQDSVAQSKDDAEYLKHALKELQTLSAEEGEEQELDARRRLMQMSERVSKDVHQASEEIGTQGVEGMLYSIQRRLASAQEKTEGLFDAALEHLDQTLNHVAEVRDAIYAVQEKLEFNPSELEQVEERLFELRRVARKHHVQPDMLPALEQELSQKLDAIEHSGEQMLALEQCVDASQAAYAEEAYALHARREQAATALDSRVMQELPALKMEHAFFCTEVEELPLSQAQQNGLSRVLFKARTNPGSDIGSIDKIASGGELSRFLLALKVCLAEVGGEPPGKRPSILVFDEIDRGVGGSTADAVGARLKKLSQQGQVFVVTHSPQVASKGNSHFYIEKHLTPDGRTQTQVRALQQSDRIHEIARMLSGENITLEAKRAADRLLQSA